MIAAHQRFGQGAHQRRGGLVVPAGHDHHLARARCRGWSASTTCLGRLPEAAWASSSMIPWMPAAAANSVLVKPGQTAVTLSPLAPYSASSDWLNLIISPLTPG